MVTGSAGPAPTYGTLTGTGQVDNGAAILLPTADVADTLSITDHHYDVDFDASGGTPDPGPASTRVLAASFTAGERAFPADPVRPGYAFDGWNTLGDGTGTFTVSYGLTDSGELRTATLVGPFFEGVEATYLLNLTDYGVPVEISRP